LIIFQNFFEKIQVSLNSDKNNGYLTQIPICIFGHISFNSSQNGKRETNVAARIRTNILCSMSSSESCALYEIMWKNIVQPDRSQMTIWRMRIACCMPMATNTLSEYVTLIAFPRQKYLHECRSILRYTYIVCLVWLTAFLSAQCSKALLLPYFSYQHPFQHRRRKSGWYSTDSSVWTELHPNNWARCLWRRMGKVC